MFYTIINVPIPVANLIAGAKAPPPGAAILLRMTVGSNTAEALKDYLTTDSDLDKQISQALNDFSKNITIASFHNNIDELNKLRNKIASILTDKDIWVERIELNGGTVSLGVEGDEPLNLKLGLKTKVERNEAFGPFSLTPKPEVIPMTDTKDIPGSVAPVIAEKKEVQENPNAAPLRNKVTSGFSGIFDGTSWGKK